MKLVINVSWNIVLHEGKCIILHIILMENTLLYNEYAVKMEFKIRV